MRKAPESPARSAVEQVATALGLVALAGCHVVESQVWNLDQLHASEGRHLYHGALQNDLEYFLRHELALVLGDTTRDWLAKEAPDRIEDPSLECLANLIELAEYDPTDPRVSGRQVEWFSRLAAGDPARLSRERSTLELGRLGARLGTGLPEALDPAIRASGPEDVSRAQAALVRAWRGGRGEDGAPPPDLAGAAAAVRTLPLDLDGSRRMLRVATELLRSQGLGTEKGDVLAALVLDLERTCVRRALASALLDPEAVVRAAAVEAAVDCAGPEVLGPVLAQLGRERSTEVLLRVLALVAEHGLPAPPAELAPEAAAQWPERMLGTIYGMLVQRSESVIRVAAMQTLGRVSGAGFESLREEDWQRWWLARAPRSEPAAPPAGGAGRGASP